MMWLQLMFDCGDMGGVMQSVGIRELRNRLSQYLALVKDGEELLVTDRGTAVARVVPVAREESAYDRLVREGLITPGDPRRAEAPLPEPVPIDGSVVELIVDGPGA